MKWHLISFQSKVANYILFFKNHLATIRTYSKQNDPAQKLYIMRHGERLDFIFRSWISNCFDANGRYVKNDLNMPASLPKRKLGASGFVRDCPLTNVGALQAKLTGDALKNAAVSIKFAYSSPSLRCVQTCHEVLAGLGLKLAIRLEPGLFECMFWKWEEPPDWMTTEEFIEAGYNIDAGYVTIITRNDLFNIKETCEHFYERGNLVMNGILGECPTGNILLAGHAPTLEVSTRMLVGSKPRLECDVRKVFEQVPYCGLITLEKKEDKWEMVEPPCLPFTNSRNQRFHWKDVLLEAFQ